ncbi:MAG TPA: DUF934 domain-containing protein [Caulobacteraceae bacterium]|jgi:uncharacterized protein (DUF934 family)|nr:DUF934 domain-containing protein [Caulobacteraceae bacterium]
MPALIRWTGQRAEAAEDPFTYVPDENHLPRGDVIVSLQRFQSEGQRLLAEGRKVGVRIEAQEAVEELAAELPQIAVVALVFPKFLTGQAYSSARILRERFRYQGEVRAVGDVLREQARFMVRCGVDTFEPADGSTPAEWTHVIGRFRHVYQRAADGREPAFVERGA